MLRERVIPCLLMTDRGFVKTKKFRNPVYIGDPINALRIFNDKYADEIIVLDIEAGLDGKKIKFDLIKQFAGELFMPLCYGGGIANIRDVETIVSSGVEKIAINTANYESLKLMRDASKTYGSQSVVGSIDVNKGIFGSYFLAYKNGRKKSGIALLDHVKKIEDAGAGEIIVQAIHKDGTKTGYDIELVQSIVENTNVPVIACGGASKFEDMADVIVKTGVAAAAAGSIFVFHGKLDGILINMPDEKQREQAFEKYKL